LLRVALTASRQRLGYDGIRLPRQCRVGRIGSTNTFVSTAVEMDLSINNDPRAVRSRQALLEAMLRLLEVKPLDQITIRDIAAEAGIGYTTFFRHHPTKESLLNDVAADQISFLINLSMPVMDAHDVRAGSAALFTFVKAHRPMWTTLLTGGAAATIREEFIRQAREVARVRMPPGGPVKAEAGVLLIVSGTIELLTWWLRQPEPLSVEQISEIHDELVVSPIIAANARVSTRPAAPAKNTSAVRNSGAARRGKK
jgi:AcrR family transcriptional regulator